MYKTIIICLSTIVLFFSSLIAEAQNIYPQNYFRSPINFPIVLSGTFGELRTNHLHSGIDIKTKGKTGEKIYAIAGGYVIRIKVSATGFGKALYVAHPNGFVSVYAHLKKFNKRIEKFVKQKHYEREEFELNIFPPKNQIKVKKEEIIAFSGNSGGSQGPHLHFEIRDEKTEKPINPFLFGLKSKDYTRPPIKLLKVYPVSDNSFVANSTQAKKYKIGGWGLQHKIISEDTIHVFGEIAFGIQTYDMGNNNGGKNGIYSVEIFNDSVLQYSHKMQTFSFDETRYVNALIDYPEFIDNKIRIQKTQIVPNNNLSVYDSVLNNGIFNFQDSLIHNISFLIKDVFGNISQLSVIIKSDPPNDSLENAGKQKSKSKEYYSYAKQNIFETDSLIVTIPTNTLYDSIIFEHEISKPLQNCFSKTYHIHNKYTPLHKSITIAIKPDSIPKRLKEKALIAYINGEKEEFDAIGGEWENCFLIAKTKQFGKYTVMLDTTPPEIIALNIHNKKKIKGYKKIVLDISDDFSGIKSYRATLNDRWILMEYDKKNDRLTYFVDDRIKKGKNVFKIDVADERGNTANYKAVIFY
ncbi:MAG: M23 family metallopeptidase [Bacteroidales bacterium]|nr:M23 family metallopeptidase [Bacteroidales bacterium]